MNSNQAGNLFIADQIVSHLVDADRDDRHNRKVARVLKSARYRYRAIFEETDFALDRNPDKNQPSGLIDGYCPERGTIGLICRQERDPAFIEITFTRHSPRKDLRRSASEYVR